jgi:hypothetical protein
VTVDDLIAGGVALLIAGGALVIRQLWRIAERLARIEGALAERKRT